MRSSSTLSNLSTPSKFAEERVDDFAFYSSLFLDSSTARASQSSGMEAEYEEELAVKQENPADDHNNDVEVDFMSTFLTSSSQFQQQQVDAERRGGKMAGLSPADSIPTSYFSASSSASSCSDEEESTMALQTASNKKARIQKKVSAGRGSVPKDPFVEASNIVRPVYHPGLSKAEIRKLRNRELAAESRQRRRFELATLRHENAELHARLAELEAAMRNGSIPVPPPQQPSLQQLAQPSSPDAAKPVKTGSLSKSRPSAALVGATSVMFVAATVVHGSSGNEPSVSLTASVLVATVDAMDRASTSSWFSLMSVVFVLVAFVGLYQLLFASRVFSSWLSSAGSNVLANSSGSAAKKTTRGFDLVRPSAFSMV